MELRDPTPSLNDALGLCPFVSSTGSGGSSPHLAKENLKPRSWYPRSCKNSDWGIQNDLMTTDGNNWVNCSGVRVEARLGSQEKWMKANARRPGLLSRRRRCVLLRTRLTLCPPRSAGDSERSAAPCIDPGVLQIGNRDPIPQIELSAPVMSAAIACTAP
ncbi:hypothetical protein HYQ44_016304 [Verticillium longisporum]|nr:hypothetical protein HYQ44_016304 [Verticillium longisporum]